MEREREREKGEKGKKGKKGKREREKLYLKSRYYTMFICEYHTIQASATEEQPCLSFLFTMI